jgi:hypothetical protein
MTTSAKPYWRPIRLCALFGLFSLFALLRGDLTWLMFLPFLFFLLPSPSKRSTEP